ncbi:hypothetical protein X975_24893, partial [Stegodyphus mimosarum]
MLEIFKTYVELNGGGCGRRSRNMGVISSPNQGIRGVPPTIYIPVCYIILPYISFQ